MAEEHSHSYYTLKRTFNAYLSTENNSGAHERQKHCTLFTYQ
jgi:hypothetical protein